MTIFLSQDSLVFRPRAGIIYLCLGVEVSLFYNFFLQILLRVAGLVLIGIRLPCDQTVEFE